MNDFELAAYHEAAHAVVALCMGVPVYSIRLGIHTELACDIPGFVPGQCLIGNGWSENVETNSIKRGTCGFARVLLDMAQAVAGIIAECRITGERFSRRFMPANGLVTDDRVNTVALSLLLERKVDIDSAVGAACAIAAKAVARQWSSIQRLARQILGAGGDFEPDEIGLYIACGLRPRVEPLQWLMDQACCGPACVAAQVAEEMGRYQEALASKNQQEDIG